MKEVEKIASSEKGVVQQTVKEILKELVDDNLVDSDKIGTSVYFWAFPGKGIYSESNSELPKWKTSTADLFASPMTTLSLGGQLIEVYQSWFPVSQQRMACLADLREKLKKLHQIQTVTLKKLEEQKAAHGADGGGDGSSEVSLVRFL